MSALDVNTSRVAHFGAYVVSSGSRYVQCINILGRVVTFQSLARARFFNHFVDADRFAHRVRRSIAGDVRVTGVLPVEVRQ